MSSPDPDVLSGLERRVTDLEIRITHQEATLDTLNDVIIRQQQLLVRLGDELKSTRKRLNELDTSAETSAQPEPPPPHY